MNQWRRDESRQFKSTFPYIYTLHWKPSDGFSKDNHHQVSRTLTLSTFLLNYEKHVVFNPLQRHYI
jgi:hypothetical protein